MKIIYLSNASIPSKTANSIHIMKMCQSFAKEGHEVILFANLLKSKSEISEVFKFYGIEEVFTIKKTLGFNIPVLGHLNGLDMAIRAKLLKPDFAIGREITGCFFSAAFKIKVYFETHGPMIESGKLSHFLFNKIIKMKSFQKFIVITHSLAKYYSDRHTTLARKMLVLPDGADEIGDIHIKPVDIKRKGKLNVGFTGHLYPGKGMEIISQLIPLLTNVHFHIIGGREQEIEHWKSCITSSNVTFHGFVPHNKVKSYINEQDIVLLPNQRIVGSNAGRDIGQWTSPLKLFEYMAQAKPIVCSDLEVLREIVEHNRNALLCDPENVNEWVAAIKLLDENNKLAMQIGKTARLDLEKNYTWRIRANKVIVDYLFTNDV